MHDQKVALWLLSLNDLDEPDTIIHEEICSIEDHVSEYDMEECRGGGVSLPFMGNNVPMMLLRRDGSTRTIQLPAPKELISANLQPPQSPCTESVKSEETQAYTPPSKREDAGHSYDLENVKDECQPIRQPKLPLAQAAFATMQAPTQKPKTQTKKRNKGRKPAKDCKPGGHGRWGFEKKERALDQPWR